MIISHKHKFIFIKPRKVAGTSIEVALSPYCEELDIITPVNPPEKNHTPQNYKGFMSPKTISHTLFSGKEFKKMPTVRHFFKHYRFYEHMPAFAIRDNLPKAIWDNYYKFTIERNPWDKTASYYYYRKSLGSLNARGISFEQFVRRRRFFSDFYMYADPNDDRLLVDKIVLLENIEKDLNEVCGEIGIDLKSFSVHAKKGSIAKNRYKKLYNEETASIVADVFSKEIEILGYKLNSK